MSSLRTFKRRRNHFTLRTPKNLVDYPLTPIPQDNEDNEDNETVKKFRRDCDAAPGKVKMLFAKNPYTHEYRWCVGKAGKGVGFYSYDDYATFEEAHAAYPDVFIDPSAKQELKRLKSLLS